MTQSELIKALLVDWYAGNDTAGSILADVLEEVGDERAPLVRAGEVWLGIEEPKWYPNPPGTGWDVFDSDGSKQIQKIDAQERFDRDEQVWAYVWQQARYRNGTAMTALAYIYWHNRQEYDAIRKAMLCDQGEAGAYVVGSVGKAVIAVVASDSSGNHIDISANHRWRVVGRAFVDDACLYSVVLDDVSDNISWEGVHYGFLRLQPNREAYDEDLDEELNEEPDDDTK